MRVLFWPLMFFWSACQFAGKEALPPQPTQIFSGHKEGENEDERARYLAVSHRAAPGVDWRAVEAANRAATLERKESRRRAADREAFAGGLVQGEWYERGSTNQAGSVIAQDYYVPGNHLYTVSSSGTIFRGKPDGTGWTALNDDLVFDNKVLQAVTNLTGGPRLVAAQGKYLYYSDNEGLNWSPSTGLSFYDTWGNPAELVELANQDLYYLD